MKVFIGAKIYDPKTGRMVGDCGFQEAHSFVSNFIKALFVVMSQIGITIPDVGGAQRSITTAIGGILGVSAAANSTTAGIIIGSGTNAVTLGDLNLQTQVTSNVYHQLMNFFMNSSSSSSFELIISRTFLNNTGSTLTITEVGLIGSSNAGNTFLIDRTLYSVVVPIGLSVTLTYKIGIAL